jgi:hypothetical protein
MCTTSFPSWRRRQPPPRRRERGRAGAGTTRLGDAGAALVDPHADLVLVLTGLDDLEVDATAPSGRAPAGRRPRRRRRRRRCVDCRGSGGRRADRGGSRACPSPPVRRAARRAHRPVASTVSSRSVVSSMTSRSPASVRMRWVVEDTPACRQRLCEAPDPVAAHLGPAAIGVVEHHASRVAGLGFTDQQPVGTDAAPAIAEPPGQVRQVVDREARDGTRRGSRCRDRGAWSG